MSVDASAAYPLNKEKGGWMSLRCLIKYNFLLVLVVVLMPVCLLSQPTIVDTVYTENSLQGAIGYFIENGTYHGGILQTGEYYFEVGDSFDNISTFCNIALRG
jgi:hypothetical protein